MATTSACELAKNEAGYPGGFVERAADEHLFEARAQRQRADRYLMMLVLLAPLAADLVQSDAEAKSAATLINKAYKDLNLMYGAAGRCLHRSTDACEEKILNSGFSFETHAHDMQRTMFSLSKFTLGAADLDGLVKDILKLNLPAILRKAKKNVPIVRRILATYRDTVVTFADAVAKSCIPLNVDGKSDIVKARLTREYNNCETFKKQIAQLVTGQPSDQALLALHDQRLIFVLLKSIDKVSVASGAKWKLKPEHLRGLVYHVDRACMRLTARQITSELTKDTVSDVTNCGSAFSTDLGIEKSDARNGFLIASGVIPKPKEQPATE